MSSEQKLDIETQPVKPKEGKGLNPYFTAMLDAKRNNKNSFSYNGNTYKRNTTSKGLIT